MSTINGRIQTIIDNYFDGSKTAFSEAVGVSTSVVDNLVGKRQSRPSFDVLQKIANLPNIPLDWLVYGEERQNNSIGSISNIAGGDNNISAPQSTSHADNALLSELVRDKSSMIEQLISECERLKSSNEDKDRQLKEKDGRIKELTDQLLECLKGGK